MPHFYLWRMILDVAISSCTSLLLYQPNDYD
nr:MAG TPA: hypothetical protein [Caudoviricetes sp.]